MPFVVWLPFKLQYTAQDLEGRLSKKDGFPDWIL